MSQRQLSPEEVRRARDLVARINGISSCQISTGDGGQITEIHVVATGPKPPKLIARDVESCLKAEMEIDVDYKKIGVVKFSPDVSGSKQDSREAESSSPGAFEEFPIEEHPSRFAFQRVNLFMGKSDVRAEVELTRDGMVAFGTCQNEDVTTSSWNLIARAALRGVSEFLDENTRLCLGGLLKVSLGEKDAIVVRVDLIGRRVTKSLAGCSIIGDNENQSVVFATLDAINRVIGILEFKRDIEYKIR